MRKEQNVSREKRFNKKEDVYKKPEMKKVKFGETSKEIGIAGATAGCSAPGCCCW